MIPSHKYKYIEVFRKPDKKSGYMLSGQSLILLLWYLYFTKMRSMRTLGFGKVCIIEFIKHRLSLVERMTYLELPVRGQLCLRVNRGHLVFDMGRETVVKVFDTEIPITAVRKEISWLCICSKLSSVPILHGWDIGCRWYEMDYVTGNMGLFLYRLPRADFIRAYYDHIEEFLFRLIKLRPPSLVNAAEYADKLIASSRLAMLTELGVDNETAREIRNFIYTQRGRIDYPPDARIYLVASHGDLNPGNIICINGGIKVLDWEDAEYRSALHDIHNIFMRIHARSLMHSDIYDAISAMNVRLLPERPDIAESIIAHANIYRRLFYIEKICKIMNRELTEARLGDIIRSVRYFQLHESIKRVNIRVRSHERSGISSG